MPATTAKAQATALTAMIVIPLVDLRNSGFASAVGSGLFSRSSPTMLLIQSEYVATLV